MKVTQPDYFDRFSCIAGACPDTCCVGWQVIPDEEHIALYESIPGELGEEIRKGIVTKDGEPTFALCEGRCCMLREDGLCKIQYALGEEALSKVCGFYPRYVTELGLLREQGLSISCPVAAGLALDRIDPVSYPTHETGEPLRYFHDIEPETILWVKKCRDEALAILQDRSQSLSSRLCSILSLIDEEEEPAPAVGEEEICTFFRKVYDLYRSLEQLRPQWGELLRSCGEKRPYILKDERLLWEHLMSYYLYKYSLRSAMDDSFETKLRLSLVHIILLRDICGKADGDPIGIVQRFAKEIEHNEDNLERLERAMEDESFSCAGLRAILSCGL